MRNDCKIHPNEKLKNLEVYVSRRELVCFKFQKNTLHSRCKKKVAQKVKKKNKRKTAWDRNSLRKILPREIIGVSFWEVERLFGSQ